MKKKINIIPALVNLDIEQIISVLTSKPRDKLAADLIQAQVAGLARSDVKERVRAAVQNKIEMFGAPQAVNTLIDIMTDRKASKGVRIDAAKTVLSRAGYVPPKAGEPLEKQKKLGELTNGELAEMLKAIHKAKMDKAITVVDARADMLL